MSKSKSISRGHIIDEHCTYQGGELVEDCGTVYSCVLNQTDIKSNKNKFYIMQLIDIDKSYVHFIRYGRIGEVGRVIYNKFSTQENAIIAFERQFRSKTGNKWSDKNNFVKKKRKYFLSEISYAEELKDVDDTVKKKNISKVKITQKGSKLVDYA